MRIESTMKKPYNSKTLNMLNSPQVSTCILFYGTAPLVEVEIIIQVIKLFINLVNWWKKVSKCSSTLFIENLLNKTF